MNNIYILIGVPVGLVALAGLVSIFLLKNHFKKVKCGHAWIYVTTVEKMHIYICKICRKVREEKTGL
jgi:hypothetical protein